MTRDDLLGRLGWVCVYCKNTVRPSTSKRCAADSCKNIMHNKSICPEGGRIKCNEHGQHFCPRHHRYAKKFSDRWLSNDFGADSRNAHSYTLTHTRWLIHTYTHPCTHAFIHIHTCLSIHVDRDQDMVRWTVTTRNAYSFGTRTLSMPNPPGTKTTDKIQVKYHIRTCILINS